MGYAYKVVKAKIGEPNWEKCTCPWHLGMGPELHCPVHGRPELTTEESRRRHLELQEQRKAKLKGELV